MLEISLNRITYTNQSTIGEIILPSDRKYFSLEDPVRKEKIPKITAIPAGRYRVVPWVFSSVNQIRPMLLSVPNYSGIFFHPGNKPTDTDGCIIPGRIAGKDMVMDSVRAYVELCSLMCIAWGSNQEVWLDIKDKEDHPWA